MNDVLNDTHTHTHTTGPCPHTHSLTHSLRAWGHEPTASLIIRTYTSTNDDESGATNHDVSMQQQSRTSCYDVTRGRLPLPVGRVNPSELLPLVLDTRWVYTQQDWTVTDQVTQCSRLGDMVSSNNGGFMCSYCVQHAAIIACWNACNYCSVLHAIIARETIA